MGDAYGRYRNPAFASSSYVTTGVRGDFTDTPADSRGNDEIARSRENRSPEPKSSRPLIQLPARLTSAITSPVYSCSTGASERRTSIATGSDVDVIFVLIA